jgi:hypothetical protein
VGDAEVCETGNHRLEVVRCKGTFPESHGSNCG